VQIPANDGADTPDALRITVRSLGLFFEASGIMYGNGLLSARPSAGSEGFIYLASDTPSLLYWDDGSTWQTIGAGAPTDPAAGIGGLRTLGSGATQAAAGTVYAAITDLTILTLMGAL
jgi:hypothetical protein